MMQFETSHHFPLASSSSDSGSGSTNDGSSGGGSPPRKTSLSVLIDADMARFSEYLDGCHGSITSAFNDRGSQHQLDDDDDQRRHYLHHQHHHQQEQEAKYAPLNGAQADELNGPADWACAALIDDGAIIPYNPGGGFAPAGDYAREAHCSSPHFGVPCWMGDHCANGGSLGLTHLPPSIDPSDDCHAGGAFAHFAMESPLEHGHDAPSPAHMEHFMPFVHHGEPEMIFAGMDLSHAADFQGIHTNAHQAQYEQYHHQQQHQLEHDHPGFFFASCVQYAPSDDINQFLPQHHQHQAMHQFDGPTMGLHASHDSDGLSPPWSASGFLAPTHCIKSDARETALHYVEPTPTLKVKTPKSRNTSNISASPSRVLRGRFSTSLGQPSAPQNRAPRVPKSSTAFSSSSSSSFQADLRLVTVLNDCYWKNGRKNLQCFPVCPEHNDFYSMKMNNRKHSSVGVCRGPVYCQVIAKAAPSASLVGVGAAAAGGPRAGGESKDATGMATRKSQRTAAMAVDCSPFSTSSLPSIPSGQHMKYEHGVGASGSGGSSQELFVLGRFERVPQRDNSDLVDELSSPPEFSSSVAFEEFRYSCFQAVEMKERRARFASPDRENLPHENGATNGSQALATGEATASGTTTGLVRSTWFFLPDVWKVQPMLKKKRKATRSAPAQTFPFCFRVFVYTASDRSTGNDNGNGGYTCVSSAVSSFFELYSTRTVDRVKRKYWSKASDASPIGTKRQARG